MRSKVKQDTGGLQKLFSAARARTMHSIKGNVSTAAYHSACTHGGGSWDLAGITFWHTISRYTISDGLIQLSVLFRYMYM